jgi:hypothetical protein
MNNTELRKLIAKSLPNALKEMRVGETCIAPDGYTQKSVTKTCVELKAKGYIFNTSTRTGVQTVTRLR